MNITVISRGLLAAVALGASVAVWAATSDEGLKDRIKPIGTVCMAGDSCAAAVVEVVSGPRTGQSLYETKCTACHAIGVAGAPKFGHAEDWEPRVSAKGMDGIFKSAWNGLNAMPPKGTCGDCTEDELKGAIEYMVSHSK